MVKINFETLPTWCQTLKNALHTIGPCCSRPIAGSFALWLWQAYVTGRVPAWTPSDVDIWHSSREEILENVLRVLEVVQKTYSGARIKTRGPAIIEIHLADDLPTLQFIHRDMQRRDAPFSFLNLFDLSVAQVAITRLDKSSVRFEFGDDGVKSDIASGVCRCFRDMSSTTDRIRKYQDRGFSIHQGEIRVLKKWGVAYQDAPPA